MSSTTAGPAIDLAPTGRARPGLALGLALVSIPGVTIAWDISGIAGCIGVAIGIAAIVLGLKARARLDGAPGTRLATAAIAIAGSPSSRSCSS